MLPQLAQGSANKVFVIPSEYTQAINGIAKGLSGNGAAPAANGEAAEADS
jgi:hypothetical protein